MVLAHKDLPKTWRNAFCCSRVINRRVDTDTLGEESNSAKSPGLELKVDSSFASYSLHHLEQINEPFCASVSSCNKYE